MELLSRYRDKLAGGPKRDDRTPQQTRVNGVGIEQHSPDSLSIFHMKNPGPLATEHLTALYNDSLKYCHLTLIWKTSLVILIPKPGKDSSQDILPLCPAAKVLEALILPSRVKDQYSFIPRLHMLSSRSQQTLRQASTSRNQLTVQCV